MAINERFAFHIKFTCQCGNCDPDKFIMKESEDAFEMHLLCVLCERQYNLVVSSQELKI